MKTIPVLAAAALLLAGTAGARAQERCSGVIADWQPRSALVKMAEDLGWTVSRIRADDGCYIIRGRDKEGKEIRARIDPVSLKVLSTRQGRGHRHGEDEDDGDEDRGRERGSGRGEGRRGHERPPAEAPGAAPSPAPESPIMKGRPQSKIQ